MKTRRLVPGISSSMLVFILFSMSTAAAAPHAGDKVFPGPMLDQGVVNYDTPDFTLSLVRSSQTVAALAPKGANGFDFTPGDLLAERSQNGYFHLGDLTLRLRAGNSAHWTDYSTASARTPVRTLPTAANDLAAADLAPTLPADIPLQIRRTWAVDDGKLVLRFELKNGSKEAVEIGALGIPMIFNNVLNNRSLDQAHLICSFYDPYIGSDAGYLQVTRLNGHGPVLLIVPDGRTPFEAYNPILDKNGPWGAAPVFTDPTPRGITFEGFYEWMVHSQAYAANEWKNAQPWNTPTSLTLAPGESKIYGLRFLIADSVQHIEQALAANQRPVAVGVPGYVLPLDVDARLFLKYGRPVLSMTVEPASAIEIREDPPSQAGWRAYTLRGKTWGRSRLTVTYVDGLVQTIHYFVIKPSAEVVEDMGHFLTTRQWFADSTDPFHRAPSVITYDRESNQAVLQDSRVWVAGLSDEGGAGSWLAAIVKQFIQPNREELDKLQQFVDGVLWGGLQSKDGAHPYGVRKSLFYYQPDQLPPKYYDSSFDWTTWTSWNKQASEAVDRSYDYPHVAVAYWVLYRLARNHQGLVTNHPWDWYLQHAYETSMAMTIYAKKLAVFGQMEGSIFVQILEDLKREGMNTQADALEKKMRERADHWKEEAYPFGSEMPWDSTGQEEVYGWTKYFGYDDKAKVTLDAVLGYDPTIPHWGYNGSARRYWDFIFAAKDRRLERQLHHYGSGLNAIPVLAEYREHPEDFYLLRVGYGGVMGALTDIDQEGFATAAFHSFPDVLRPDPFSGDYGSNFFGHAWNAATYIVHHPEFGWVVFGGNVKVQGNVITVTPRDSFRARIYVAPLGLWLTLDAGKFEVLEVNSSTGAVRIGLAKATGFTPVARLRVEQPAKTSGVRAYRPTTSLRSERDAYVIPLQKKHNGWNSILAIDSRRVEVICTRNKLRLCDESIHDFYSKRLLQYASKACSQGCANMPTIEGSFPSNPMDIREIARRAKVSTATVSRAINRVPTVDPQLAKRVWKVVDELGYYPNTQARALVLGRTRIFGLIVSEITNPFFPEIVQTFENLAVENNYEILLTSTVHDPKRMESSVRRMIERRVDGVAILTFGMEETLIEHLRFRKVPLVFIDVGPDVKGISNIRINYQNGIRQAVQHLAALRHTRIAFVSGPLHLKSALARREAFKVSMNEIGLSPDLIVVGDHRMEGGMKALVELNRLTDPPTAVMCSNDMTAIGVMREAYDHNIRIPNDLSVVGFDDIRLAEFTIPPLTTVQMSQTELSKIAFQALLNEVESEQPLQAHHEYDLNTALILRRSTALARAEDPPTIPTQGKRASRPRKTPAAAAR